MVNFVMSKLGKDKTNKGKGWKSQNCFSYTEGIQSSDYIGLISREEITKYMGECNRELIVFYCLGRYPNMYLQDLFINFWRVCF